MVTPTNCPNCGAALPAGATTCASCGHSLSEAPTVQVPTPQPPEQASPPPQQSAAPPPPPPPPPTAQPPSAAAPGTSVSDMLEDVRTRWGVGQSPALIAALVLAAAAVAIGTLATISYLIAGDDEISQKFDAQVWFSLAIPLSLGAAALLVLVRLQSGAPREETAAQDWQGYLVLNGLVVVFALLGLFKGFDESFEAMDAWFSYSAVFAFLTLGLAAIARPVPANLGGTNGSVAGLAAVGIGVVVLLIGTLQGRSDDFSTYAQGISLQRAGFVLMLLAFAWFLGMRKAEA